MSDNIFERDGAPQNAAGAEKWLDKIRKILAKASAAGCSEAERLSLNEKAAALMAKYGIDRARAMDAGTNGDQMACSPYCFYDATHKAQATLMYRIAEALGCKAVFNPAEADPEFESTGLTVIGYLSDTERAETFYESLYLQMVSAAVKVPRSARPSFMDGWSREVADRIKAAENRARADEAPAGSSTALVLASREVAVRQNFATEFPVTSKSRAISRNVDGYLAGQAAGKHANIGGTRVGGGGRAALAG